LQASEEHGLNVGLIAGSGGNLTSAITRFAAACAHAYAMSGLGLAILDDPASTASPTLHFLHECHVNDIPTISSTNTTGPDSQCSPVCHGTVVTSAAPAAANTVFNIAAAQRLGQSGPAAVQAPVGSHGVAGTQAAAGAAAGELFRKTCKGSGKGVQ
jgi:hypothetical protein